MDLLQATSKTTCKLADPLIDPCLKLSVAQEVVTINKEMYQQLVGKLMYLSHTWPNIAYGVSLKVDSCTIQSKCIYKHHIVAISNEHQGKELYSRNMVVWH